MEFNVYALIILLFKFYANGDQSVQFVRRALHYANGNRLFLRESFQPQEGRLYIVIHRQAVLLYHNSSVWLDASSWDRNPANFTSAW